MGKNQSQQSLARRNIADVVCSGSSGPASGPTTTIDQPTAADTEATIDATDDDTGRESVPSEPEIDVTDVMLELPMVDTPLGYVTRRVDTKLNTVQATRLKSIKFGLQARNARLKNGVLVRTDGHVLAWILEQI